MTHWSEIHPFAAFAMYRACVGIPCRFCDVPPGVQCRSTFDDRRRAVPHLTRMADAQQHDVGPSNG